MILVRIRTLALLAGVSLGGIAASAAWAYSVGTAAGRKGDAESALFIGLVAAGAELALWAAALSAARKKQKELDALAALVRHGGNLPFDRLKSFGPIGDRIRSILTDLSDASERKGVRIASLTGLLRAALELLPRPILVTGLDGIIAESSGGALKDPRLAELKPGFSRIQDIFPSLDPVSILQEADRTHSLVRREGAVDFHPVFSIRGEITHFIVDIAPTSVFAVLSPFKQAEERNNAERPKGGVMGFIRGMLRRPGKESSDRD